MAITARGGRDQILDPLTRLGQRLLTQDVDTARKAGMHLVEVRRCGRADDDGIEFGCQKFVEAAADPGLAGFLLLESLCRPRALVEQGRHLSPPVPVQSFGVQVPHASATDDTKPPPLMFCHADITPLYDCPSVVPSSHNERTRAASTQRRHASAHRTENESNQRRVAAAGTTLSGEVTPEVFWMPVPPFANGDPPVEVCVRKLWICAPFLRSSKTRATDS